MVIKEIKRKLHFLERHFSEHGRNCKSIINYYKKLKKEEKNGNKG